MRENVIEDIHFFELRRRPKGPDIFKVAGLLTYHIMKECTCASVIHKGNGIYEINEDLRAQFAIGMAGLIIYSDKLVAGDLNTRDFMEKYVIPEDHTPISHLQYSLKNRSFTLNPEALALFFEGLHSKF